jgi:tRNA1(Val) A37 N6-methylase TrmN6
MKKMSSFLAQAADEAPAIDSFLNGRLKIRQAAKGHRIGTDAMLLAASVDVDKGRAFDVGAGVGVVGLACALSCPALTIGLIEIDTEVAALAQENIELNHLRDRVSLYHLDICDPAQRRALGLEQVRADVIITNPPYLDPAHARLSPDPQKRNAHAYADQHVDGQKGGLDAWMRACVAISAPHARVVMIHRADALPEIFQAMKGRFGGLEIMPVFSRPDRPAIRVLVRGWLGSRAPHTLHPPLVLHNADGQFTAQARAINEGLLQVPFLKA